MAGKTGSAMMRARQRQGIIVKQPEKPSSETAKSPQPQTGKAGAEGAVIKNAPLSKDAGEAAKPTEGKPPIDSTLVGASSDSRPGAEKRAAGKAPETAATTATPTPAGPTTSVPPVPPARVETRVVEVRKGRFLPLFLGGVVAAGLGAGATYWALPYLPPALLPAGAGTSSEAQLQAARDAGAEAAKAELAAQNDAFVARAASAGADAARQLLADTPAPAALPATAPVEATELQAMLKAQQDKLAALEGTLAALSSRPASTASPSTQPLTAMDAPSADALRAELDQLRAQVAAQDRQLQQLEQRPALDAATAQRIEQLANQAGDAQQQISAVAAQAEQRIASAEEQARALEQTAADANRRALAAAAVAHLQAAMESGGDRASALQALTEAGIELPAVLTGEVPTLSALQSGFDTAARAGLAAARKEAGGEGGAMGAIGNFLRVQTGARSVEPREGDDPDAILSRANAAVTAGDIAGALAEIVTLPASGQEAMAGWTASASTWVQANAALAVLAAGGK